MEFLSSNKFSKLISNQKNNSVLVNTSDVISMLRNVYLHDIHSHFIVTPEGTYDDTWNMVSGIQIGRIERLEQSFRDGCTIIIKDLENWNDSIKARCTELGDNTNVHLYLTPGKGSGFDWHTDDRDVFVHCQLGEKSFQVKEPNGKISKYILEAGDILYIPYGAKHKALATDRPSVHLSFGVWPDNMTIKNSYQEFEIPINLEL